MTCTARASQPARSVAYDRDLFKGQLLDLLERLEVTDPVHLVGFSFGGATAANFTAAHPDKVRTLALIAPVFRFEEGNASHPRGTHSSRWRTVHALRGDEEGG